VFGKFFNPIWHLAKKLKFYMLWLYVKSNNCLSMAKKSPIATDLAEFNEVCLKSRVQTDFNDHLTTLFTEALSQNPEVIVELGTRGGESTFVLERIANLCNSVLISVDLDDCSKSSRYPGWLFVQSDDIQFSRKFKKWCIKHKIKPEINLLFIDTSHLYAHTIEEIENLFPHLAKRGKVIFHDTNLKYIYSRKDGSLGISGWDNQRGVIKALEHYLDQKYDETRPFLDIRKGWLIRHWPNCSGLTILDKISD
jgi:hypothetical protein